MQTEYLCRLKEKVLNEQTHTHQPGRVLGSILLVPIFYSNETAMKRMGCKLCEEITYKDPAFEALNQTRLGVA